MKINPPSHKASKGKKKYMILAISAIALLGVTAMQYKSGDVQAPPVAHLVELRADGFNPKDITINKGDTVTFSTNRGFHFWPASNLHPSHTIYPEFDPQEPIEPDKIWSFKFDQMGVWKYHDHLAPLYVGTITVQKYNKPENSVLGSTESKEPERCYKLQTDDEKTNCWQESIQYTLDSSGITPGFKLYAEFYNREPLFAENCHAFTHQIGEAGYKAYSSTNNLDVTSSVAYCSYGFFHGFIEAMFHDKGTLEGARNFCDYIDEKLKDETDVLNACMHGIGHGVTDGSDPRAWGDVKAIIAPGKALCEKIGRDEYEKMICATGVFNSLEAIYMDPKYKLNIDRNDPFWICREQETEYFKRACYDDFKDIIMVIANNDFAKAAIFVEGIEDTARAGTAIDNLATYAAYSILRQPSYDYAIDICHNLQPRLHVECVAGLGAGFMTAGVPDKEYVKAIELCQSPRITEVERTACFERVLRLSQLRYSAAIHKQACNLVDIKDKTDACAR